MSRLPAVLLAPAVLLLGACASRGYESSQACADAMQASIAAADGLGAKRQVAFDTLNALMEGGEGLPAKFEAFSAAVDGVTAAGADLEKSIAGMKGAAEKRFADWEAGEAAYTTESVRARSQQRRGEARGLFDASVAAAEEMDRQGKGFMAFLVDIRLLLSNDLTSKGIEGTKDLAQNARASNGKLHQLTQPTITALKAAAEGLSTK